MPITSQVKSKELLKESYFKKEGMPRILLVDDDVEMLEELKEALSFHNYDVEVMSNSSLAFEVACELKPDLVILDLKMKPKSGFQLADELSNSYLTKMIPVIAITGYFTEKEHQLMMKMCGLKHTILKPFDPVDLAEKIGEIIKESKGNT